MILSLRRASLSAALVFLTACGGGGGDGTGPATVDHVVITSPAAPPTFGALGRTVQFAAQARDAGDAPVTATISWLSSNPAVATVSGSGLVTAAENGTAQVRATAGGVQSAPVTVTVSQVPAQVVITPSAVAFGAIGSQRQLTAAVQDSTANAIAAAAVTWTRAGPGTTASVSGTGLVTAVGVGTADTAVATAGSITAKAPIAVTQVVTSVVVSSIAPAPDTLRTTGSTRQFSALARDSNANVIGSAAFTWSTNAASVATVGPTGLVTGVADGSANITATATGTGVGGSRAVVVQRYAATFTLAPTSASITTNGGTANFGGTAQDSSGANLTIGWVSRNTAIVTVNPAAGTATTATATGNGSTYVVMSGGTRRDSAQVTVSNQAGVSFSAAVQPIFTAACTSCHNGVGGSLPGVMNLTQNNAYNAIVNVNSLQNPALKRVLPGDVANSYLARKIDPTLGPIIGDQMPAAGSLTAQQIQTIKNWIAQGALNN
jgi:hypothetical protein